MVIIAGQSNAGGGAQTTDLTAASPYWPNLPDPYPSVIQRYQIAPSAADPIPWGALTTGVLAPRGTLMGVELSMGRSGSPLVILKFAVAGTGLAADWVPSSTYPTLPPAGPNLYSQMVSFIQQAEIDFAIPLEAFVWIQGNGDANMIASANAYAANLAIFLDQIRADLGKPDLPFLFDQLDPNVVATYVSVVRAQQALFAANTPNVFMVNTDDLPLRDADHYTADSFAELGVRFGDILALLGASMSPIVRRAASKLSKFIERTGDPAAEADRILLYAKDTAGITELYARSSDGTVHQLTPNGGFPPGAVGTPGAFVIGDPNTGLYQTALNELAVTAGGVQAALFTAQGMAFPVGAVGTPGLYIVGDPDTGFYQPAADQIGIAVGGVAAASWVKNAVTSEGQLVFSQLGTSANPVISLGGTNTGLFAVANTLIIVGNGTIAARFSSGGIRNGVAGSAGVPSYTWFADQDTGLSNPAADTIRVSTNSSAKLDIDANVTAAETALLVSVAGAAVSRVSVGANDSGGAGFRVLRVPN